jgi:antitoxin component of MazEF toxin-antitoxin module
MNVEQFDFSQVPKKKPVYSLAQLLAEVTPENIHGEVDWGEPLGLEIWNDDVV